MGLYDGAISVITIVATGGFDPIHTGHINYLKEAALYGTRLVVGVNSDAWLIRKKGRAFMPFEERAAIVEALGCVDEVIAFDDSDGTAIDCLEQVKRNHPMDTIIFVNGGDRTSENIPEMVFDDVEFVFGVGGEDKKNSSSWILEEWKSPKTIRPWGWYRVLDDKSGYKVKELVIAPGQSLSMQRHKHRAEHWYILKGECTFNVINISSDIEELGKYKENHTITIEKDKWHQACNTTTEPCHILEVQYGDKCIEEDIVRMK